MNSQQTPEVKSGMERVEKILRLADEWEKYCNVTLQNNIRFAGVQVNNHRIILNRKRPPVDPALYHADTVREIVNLITHLTQDKNQCKYFREGFKEILSGEDLTRMNNQIEMIEYMVVYQICLLGSILAMNYHYMSLDDRKGYRTKQRENINKALEEMNISMQFAEENKELLLKRNQGNENIYINYMDELERSRSSIIKRSDEISQKYYAKTSDKSDNKNCNKNPGKKVSQNNNESINDLIVKAKNTKNIDQSVSIFQKALKLAKGVNDYKLQHDIVLGQQTKWAQKIMDDSCLSRIASVNEFNDIARHIKELCSNLILISNLKINGKLPLIEDEMFDGLYITLFQFADRLCALMWNKHISGNTKRQSELIFDAKLYIECGDRLSGVINADKMEFSLSSRLSHISNRIKVSEARMRKLQKSNLKNENEKLNLVEIEKAYNEFLPSLLKSFEADDKEMDRKLISKKKNNASNRHHGNTKIFSKDNDNDNIHENVDVLKNSGSHAASPEVISELYRIHHEGLLIKAVHTHNLYEQISEHRYIADHYRLNALKFKYAGYVLLDETIETLESAIRHLLTAIDIINHLEQKMRGLIDERFTENKVWTYHVLADNQKDLNEMHAAQNQLMENLKKSARQARQSMGEERWRQDHTPLSWKAALLQLTEARVEKLQGLQGDVQAAFNHSNVQETIADKKSDTDYANLRLNSFFRKVKSQPVLCYSSPILSAEKGREGE